MPVSPQIALFVGSLLGAVALVLMMPKARGNFRVLGGLLGAATLGGLWLFLAGVLREVGDDLGGMTTSAFAYYYVFSAIAIAGAVRVITHTRPVYSALWFVMVILASAGLFLTLTAEFMAFAMVIIYAGAILVTYVFVIMLAAQSGQPGETAAPDVSPTYDRLAREPLAATVAGFVLLAVLLSVAFGPMERNEAAAGPEDAALISNVLTDRPDLDVRLGELTGAGETADQVLPGQEQLAAALQEQEAGQAAGQQRVSNSERIGVDLFRSHPLGLELAGVILLVALIGAVVIARTQIPGEEMAPGGPAPEVTGATTHPTHEPGPDEPESIGQSGGRMGV